MGARGAYAKGKAKRAEVLDVAIAVVARDGYSSATVKNLADAVGLSQNGLLHYFGSKDALFVEILRHHDEVVAERIGHSAGLDYADSLVARLITAAEEEAASPGMLQLSMRLTGEATETNHVAHEYFRAHYEAIRGVIHDAIDHLKADGRMAADTDAEATCHLILAAWDGLRIQWMFDDSIDVPARLTHLLHALGISPSTKVARRGQ